MNPKATIEMENGRRIVIELCSETAYNEVCSFIWAADNGFYNDHAIERVVPGYVLDVSYTAFHHKECQFFLPNRIAEETGGNAPIPHPGDVCFGFYSDKEISGVEFFFPFGSCEKLQGKCPVIGHVIEGMDEILRLEKIDTVPVPYAPDPNIEINRPKEPQIIRSVTVDTFGVTYPAPEKVTDFDFPDNWRVM